MKTPKRNTNWHGCTDGVDFETYRDTIISQHARWKRKNREARLKHALREKDWQIEVKKAQMRGYMRACVTLRSNLKKEMRLTAKYEKAVSASGTFGQDIEGS